MALIFSGIPSGAGPLFKTPAATLAFRAALAPALGPNTLLTAAPAASPEAPSRVVNHHRIRSPRLLIGTSAELRKSLNL